MTSEPDRSDVSVRVLFRGNSLVEFRRTYFTETGLLMSDYASARAAGIAAIDELDAWQGKPLLSSELASIVAISAARDAAIAARDIAVTERDGLNVKIANARTAAQAESDDDTAKQAGKGVLDALA